MLNDSVSSVTGRLSVIAADHQGMFTSREATEHGVTRPNLTRLARQGVIERLMQGVYRFTSAPRFQHELVYASWLAVGGCITAPGVVPPVVVAGETAAGVLGLGDFYPGELDFITPRRKTTRHPGVRLRTRQLSPGDVLVAEGMTCMSIERTIADLVENWADDTQIARVLADAIDQHRLLEPARLEELLAPLASARGFRRNDGKALLEDFVAAAGLTPQALIV